MTLFRGIDFENLEDGEYIQFFGVNRLSWGYIERATGIKPTIAFIEDDTLEKQNADLVAALDALEFYAKEDNYTGWTDPDYQWSGQSKDYDSAIEGDMGEIARQALDTLALVKGDQP